jgi:ribosomal protein S5
VSIVTHGRAKARMVENAIRVGSEAAAANMPAVIAEWSRRHPGLVAPAAAGDAEPTPLPVEPAS